MKKIAILCTANIKHMTLISLYTERFVAENQDFDIIYIDKYHEVEKYQGANKLFRYELFLKPNWTFTRKLIAYWGFKKYAINVIKNQNYDFIIVWNEFTAFMFEDYLGRHFQNRYCVNIRDENYNHISMIQHRYKRVLEKSCFNTISSDRFRSVFPKGDYLFIQSYNRELIKDVEKVKEKRVINEPLRLMFIGRMSYPNTIKRAIDAFANDLRFELWLIGEGCDTFESYVKEIRVSNVIIRGAFQPEETKEYLQYADIIFSLNKENDVHSDTLLPIKLYYAIGRNIPILAYKSSYTYEYAKKYGFDIGISDIEFDRIGDIVFKRYSEISQTEIVSGCQKALSDINVAREKLDDLINRFILV